MRHMKEGLLTGDFRLDNGWFFTTKAGFTARITCSVRSSLRSSRREPPQDAVYRPPKADLLRSTAAPAST